MKINNKDKNIVLIGFMGSGKTSVGKRLSLVLKREFIDTDDFIEKREGMTINEIFKEKGEEEFRKIERELYKRFSTPKKKIIATGGGVIKNPANIANLKKGGVIVYLKSSPEKIKELTGMSKNEFKRAAGNLYKQRLVQVEEHQLYQLSSCE